MLVSHLKRSSDNCETLGTLGLQAEFCGVTCNTIVG